MSHLWRSLLPDDESRARCLIFPMARLCLDGRCEVRVKAMRLYNGGEGSGGLLSFLPVNNDDFSF